MVTATLYFCPDCMGPLAIDDDDSARCTLHGGDYRVLFHRHPIASAEPAAAAVPGSAPARPAALQGLFCAQHPTVAATRHCQYCFACMCDTCAFALPGDIYICPKCATDPRPQLSPRRVKARRWSLGLAGLATLAWTIIFAGSALGLVTKGGDNEALLGLAGIAMVFAPIAGIATGLSAMDRRLGNPPSLRAAVIWNGILLGALVLSRLAK